MAEYEEQWKGWRQHLLQNRESLRKQMEEKQQQQQQQLSAIHNPNSLPGQRESTPKDLPNLPNSSQSYNVVHNLAEQRQQPDVRDYPNDYPKRRMLEHHSRDENIPQENCESVEPSGASLFRKRAIRGRVGLDPVANERDEVCSSYEDVRHRPEVEGN